MYNISLEQFYKRINGKINLVSGYLQDKSYKFIIKSCRLKPTTVFSNQFSFQTSLENEWVDEFGNSLQIENRKARIALYSKKYNCITTDLYRYENINTILKLSRLACVGLRQNGDSCLLCLGLDNYFRCFFIDENIKTISPLVIGLEVIKQITQTKQPRHFTIVYTQSEMVEWQNTTWFMLSLPADKLFLPNVLKYEKLRRILFNE